MADEGPKTTKATAFFKDSVFLAAFIAAVVAASANAYVAFINSNTLVDVEIQREAEERFIETKKAEFTRLLEISKLDVGPAKQKIKAFCEMVLITDPAICSANSAGAISPTNTANFVPVTWDSPWVSGGHNQQEMCNQGISELGKVSQYKGREILMQSATEDSRKDFLGHVEYRYHCIYRVSDTGGR